MSKAERDVIRVRGVDRVFNRNKILLVLLIQLAMSMMAISSMNVAIPSIEAGLGASPADVQWVLSGYALLFGIALVPAGRAGDVMGRGSWFVVGIVVYTVAAAACALAPDPAVLNLARFAQGLGAGLATPQVTGMIQQFYQGQGRAKAFAMFGLVVSASVAVGPIITGFLIQLTGPAMGWRVMFVLNVLMGITTVILALAWFPFETERTRRFSAASGEERPKIDLDPVGALLLSSAVVAIMLPFILRTDWGWVLIPVGIVLVLFWLRWEIHYKASGREPMVDLDMFTISSFTFQTAISGTMFLGSTSMFVVLAMFLQTGNGVSALNSSLVGLPNAIVSAIFAIVAGRYALSRGRNVVMYSLIAMIIGVAGSILVVFLMDQNGISFWWLMVPLVLVGVGQGSMGSANQTLAVVEIPVSDGGVAGGVKQTVERVATAVGNAIVTAILFMTVASGWAEAMMAAYGLIGIILVLALVLAVIDRVRHGAGVAGY